MSTDPYAAWEGGPPALAQANHALQLWLQGPAMMGWLTHVFLFGIVVSSFFHYLASDLYNSDSRRTKILAWTVLLVDFAAVLVNTAQAFFYSTNSQRDPITLVIGTFPVDSFPPLMAGTEAVLVQLYLIRRASRLFIRQRKLRDTFLLVASSLSILSFIGSIVVTTFYFMYFGGVSFSSTATSIYVTQIVSGVWLSLAAFIDCSISFTLTMLIKGQLKALMSEGSRADGVLRKVMSLGLETALYTSLMCVAGAITTTCFNANQVWTVNVFFAFTYPLPACYAFSFLVTLRSREKYREMVLPAVTPAIASVVVTRHTNIEVDLADEESMSYGSPRRVRLVRMSAPEKVVEDSDEKEQDQEYLQ